MRESVTFVEIDADRCTLEYGVSPCTASIGDTGSTNILTEGGDNILSEIGDNITQEASGAATGTRKCYNTRATCQDVANYSPAPETIRFAASSDFLYDVDQGSNLAIPSVISVSHSPTRIRIAEDLGERAGVTVSFMDHLDSDERQDPYISERPDPAGTFWGRFRARQRYLLGRPLRWIEGAVGEDLADMSTRHYIIESISGPDIDGRVSISAKDTLKLADGDRAQAPKLSSGKLAADITATATAATLTPEGIGNLEYPANGKIAINDEVMIFSRTGDTLSLVRAQSFTEADEHEANDQVQLLLIYENQSASAIISDLLYNYANVPAGMIDIESDTGFNYYAEIAEPTAVRQLVSELMEQASITIFFDELTNKIRYRYLRNLIASSNFLNQNIILANSFSWKDVPDRRVSQVWVYYGQRNPLEKLDEQSNYAVASLEIDQEAEGADEYGRPAIKKVFSRWIRKTGTLAAQDTSDIILSRFRNIPRVFNWSLQACDNQACPKMGDTVSISMPPIQDDTGAQATIAVSITSRSDSWDGFDLQAEEFRVQPRDPSAPVSINLPELDPGQTNYILRDVFDLETDIEASDDTDITFVVPTGVLVGGNDEAPSISTGDWPTGATVTLRVDGSVYGRGGRGGTGNGFDGLQGFAAISATRALLLENNGLIAGGGGGGGGGGVFLLNGELVLGGGGGGGGRGSIGGPGGSPGFSDSFEKEESEPGEDGTALAPGAGGSGAGVDTGGGFESAGDGGTGGQLGTAGNSGQSGSQPGGDGGAAGFSIDGNSFVTLSGSGTLTGPTNP